MLTIWSYLGAGIVLALFGCTVLFHVLMTYDGGGIHDLTLFRQPEYLSERGRWYQRMYYRSLCLLIVVPIVGHVIAILFGFGSD
jgi:hypothetical protein